MTKSAIKQIQEVASHPRHTLGIIAAINPDNVIGKDGGIPWNYPGDLKFFKELTLHHPVIMGRKTWESLPEKVRPLPNRANYVLTSSECRDAIVARDFDSLLAFANYDERFVWVMGGSSVYRLAERFATIKVITEVPDKVEGENLTSYNPIHHSHAVVMDHPYEENLKVRLTLRKEIV